ncbi:hypothetical protein Hanom_Chr03g00257791 [Helianthus anomalus]
MAALRDGSVVIESGIWFFMKRFGWRDGGCCGCGVVVGRSWWSVSISGGRMNGGCRSMRWR